MTVIRKACRNCNRSKRKCNVQLPSCHRCVQKGLDCVYDLDHLNTTNDHSGQTSDFWLKLKDHDRLGHCLLRMSQSCAPGIDPHIGYPGKQEPYEYIRLGYASIPDIMKEKKPALFIHPKLQLHSTHAKHLAGLIRSGVDDVTFQDFMRLTQLDITTIPIQETLTACQALIIYLATYIFSPEESERKGAESSLDVLSKWTDNLYTSALTCQPNGRSPWQQWLFCESVRRTIVSSYAFFMLLDNFRLGYCTNWLFLESLPFDKRPGLWMASSAQAWIAAAGARTGSDVGERLSSVHEFAESYVGSDPGFCGDIFMIMLAISHNGYKRPGA
ncbi:unnamed protein product [Clonostachys rosea]|uniref:Zn(2)-C6 fungal-type domain-containing protein n=1 Tax=Bionectria ochroleuca TaxID=29856 RepID=A0ABY6ULU4_BIOOC|nr:unnamed protein product [Clonostachys rosea]